MRQELIDLVGDMVSFESTVDKIDQKKAVLKHAQEWLEDKGVVTEWFDHKESPSLVATVQGDLDKTVLLSGHLDVVPAEKKSFQMRVEGDKLLGRGVIDDKGSVAILMIFLSKIVGSKGYPTFKLMLTTDEEVGGSEGAGRLAKKGLFDGVDAVYVIDGGNKNEIVTKEKGIIHVLFKVQGKACHGSRPWLGDNAIDKALVVYGEIKELFAGQRTDVDNNWYSTVNLGKIHGGEAINAVPDEAQMGLDIRFTENWSLETLKPKIEKIITQNDGEIIHMAEGDLLDSDANHPIIKKYIKVISKATDEKLSIVPEHGASDARFFNYLNVPIWIHYPDGGSHHSESEWVSISSMEKLMNGLVEFFGKLNEKDFN